MKIEKVDMQIFEFDARDVIATSSGIGGQDDDAVTVIWLNKESIAAFNSFTKDDINLSAGGAREWSSYSGTITYEPTDLDPPNDILVRYSIATSQDEPPSIGIYTVRPKNESDYNKVLAWLTSHGTRN